MNCKPLHVRAMCPVGCIKQCRQFLVAQLHQFVSLIPVHVVQVHVQAIIYCLMRCWHMLCQQHKLYTRC